MAKPIKSNAINCANVREHWVAATASVTTAAFGMMQVAFALWASEKYSNEQGWTTGAAACVPITGKKGDATFDAETAEQNQAYDYLQAASFKVSATEIQTALVKRLAMLGRIPTVPQVAQMCRLVVAEKGMPTPEKIAETFKAAVKKPDGYQMTPDEVKKAVAALRRTVDRLAKGGAFSNTVAGEIKDKLRAI